MKEGRWAVRNEGRGEGRMEKREDTREEIKPSDKDSPGHSFSVCRGA